MARFETIRMLTRYEAKDALPVLEQVLLRLELGAIVHALTQLSVLGVEELNSDQECVRFPIPEHDLFDLDGRNRKISVPHIMFKRVGHMNQEAAENQLDANLSVC